MKNFMKNLVIYEKKRILHYISN